MALGLAMLVVAGCRQDMQDQPKYIPLRSAFQFYPDMRSARMPVAGTIARGELREDDYFYTGKINGLAGDRLPMPLTMALLKRGQQRFQIYCTPCHSRVGDGNGMIPQRGLKHPPSYHTDLLRKAPLGHFYDVMTNGFGVMLNYKAQVTPEDRWAIAAYIRALQLSQDATLADVPPAERDKIEEPQAVNMMIQAPPTQPSGTVGGGVEIRSGHQGTTPQAPSGETNEQPQPQAKPQANKAAQPGGPRR